MREAKVGDAAALAGFFADQPEEAFEFFKPHGFDEKSLAKILANKAFLTYVVMDGECIVGYFFLRSFVNGKCFRGKIVDYRWQGKGFHEGLENHAVETARRMLCKNKPMDEIVEFSGLPEERIRAIMEDSGGEATALK